MFNKDAIKKINLTTELIPLKNDYEGKVSAAVEYRVLPEADTAVLYIHGYMGYFFNITWLNSLSIKASVFMPSS